MMYVPLMMQVPVPEVRSGDCLNRAISYKRLMMSNDMMYVKRCHLDPFGLVPCPLFHLKDWIWIGRLRAEAMRDWTIVIMVQMTCWRCECSWLSLTNYKVLAPSESLHTRTSGRLTFSADLLLYTYACIHTNTHMHGIYTYTYWHCMCYCIPWCRKNFGVFILAKHLYTTQLASLNQLPTGVWSSSAPKS